MHLAAPMGLKVNTRIASLLKVNHLFTNRVIVQGHWLVNPDMHGLVSMETRESANHDQAGASNKSKVTYWLWP